VFSKIGVSNYLGYSAKKSKANGCVDILAITTFENLKRYLVGHFQMNYRSRAAFKLLELNMSHSLINRKNVVFDFGCSPGGWSQISSTLAKSTESNPTVFGIDLLHTPDVVENLNLVGRSQNNGRRYLFRRILV
jgi:hypothetical protein